MVSGNGNENKIETKIRIFLLFPKEKCRHPKAEKNKDFQLEERCNFTQKKIISAEREESDEEFFLDIFLRIFYVKYEKNFFFIFFQKNGFLFFFQL